MLVAPDGAGGDKLKRLMSGEVGNEEVGETVGKGLTVDAGVGTWERCYGERGGALGRNEAGWDVELIVDDCG